MIARHRLPSAGVLPLRFGGKTVARSAQEILIRLLILYDFRNRRVTTLVLGDAFHLVQPPAKAHSFSIKDIRHGTIGLGRTPAGFAGFGSEVLPVFITILKILELLARHGASTDG